MRPAPPLTQDLAAKDETGRTDSQPTESDPPPTYDDDYYDALHAGAVRSAAAVVPFVQDIVAARRVVDLGCGTGAWLAAFQAHGATRILGIDLPPLGNESPPIRAIPSTDFLAWNLTDPLKTKRRFDLAISLEVGEHLPLRAADIYLDSLVRLAPIVLFSAAIPDQGGEHHENEQWPAWWATRFKERGYLTFDFLRTHFWDDLRVETWYAQNMLLFVRETEVERYPKFPKIDREAVVLPQALVHPRWWVFTLQQHRAVEAHLTEAEIALHAAEGRLHEAETAQWDAETALHAAEERLHEAETGQWRAETALSATEERLHEAEEACRQQEHAARERLQAARHYLARSLVGVPPVGERPRALIIVPGSLNYFYDQAGQRIAETLRNLGFRADIRTLRAITDPVPRYDNTFVVNIAETILAYGSGGDAHHRTGRLDPAEEQRALDRLADVRAAVGGPTAAVQLDCVQTWWFAHASNLCGCAGIPTLLDLGFHDQSADLTPAQARLYRFVFNGLTESERADLDTLDLTAPRPVPWVFVGHMTEDRVRLVQRIMSEVDLKGFVYMPTLAPFTANGPHLNEQQLMSVLGQARYQIWCAHHTYFYLESERFRQSVLAGAVPIKLRTTALPSEPFPFTNFVLDEETFPDQLRAIDFPTMQQRAIDEFKALPGLEEGLLSFLALTSGRQTAWNGRWAHAMGAQDGS